MTAAAITPARARLRARIIDPSVSPDRHPLGLTNNPEWAKTRDAYAERECANIVSEQRAFEAEQCRTGSLRKAIPGFYWITFLQLATCVAVAAFVIGAAATWGAGS